MASHYVPPHRKRQLELTEHDNAQSQKFQQASWQALTRSITGIINKASADNLEQSATELFRENIVRGRGLLARSLMRTQQVDPDLTPVLASLASRVNKELPHVILLLCKRLVVQWNRTYIRKDWRALENTSRFLVWLYIFHVVEVDVLYQIIVAHLTSEKRSDEDIDQAAKVFREAFKAMSQRARREFHEQVLSPFRDLLAMDSDEWRLSPRSQAVLESCLKEVQQWEHVKDDVSVIPEPLILFDLETQTTHAMDLEEKYATEDTLDRYSFDPQYEQHEASYEEVRKVVLGENWEMELLEQAAAAEEEDEENEEDELDQATEADSPHAESGASRSAITTAAGGVSGGATSAPSSSTSMSTSTTTLTKEQQQAQLDASKTLIDEAERQVRKEVYMAMRSSVRADEAVHKILKQMKPQTERTICFMVVEGCCEERSYKKMYGMAAERLCKSNARFQAFFAESFRTRYLGAQELTVKQIEYTSKLFSHLLRTDSLYWGKCFAVMDILHNDESQRLFIQYLFQGLSEEMGMPALVSRLRSDRELQSSLTRLFPIDSDAASLEMAVNLYVAMGLGELASPLRETLEAIRGRGMKRRRRDDDLEYV